MNPIAYCKIFPPIGIARIGDSRDDDGWFVGPEFPHESPHKKPEFRFRDAEGRIMRQAARFRVFGFDADGVPVQEVTAAEADITWHVSLANKKAAWFEFNGTDQALRAHRGKGKVPQPRNVGTGTLTLSRSSKPPRYVPDAKRVEQLEINGGSRAISGRSRRTLPTDPESQYRFVGRFKTRVDVELGELRTDEEGRLLVLGGRGVSDAVDADGRSIRSLRWIRNYANNDDWYDDTSDGPVNATVVLHDGKRSVDVADGAWVIVAPPDFAPDVANVVSLFDVMEEVAHRNPELVKPGTEPPRSPPSVYFSTDIEPILQSISDQRWVNAMGLRGHGYQKAGDFQQSGSVGELQPELADPSLPGANQLRARVFGVLRQPAYQRGPGDKDRYDSPTALAQATGIFMPPLAGDEGDPEPGEPNTWLSLTYLQYDRLKAWSEGDFKPGDDPARPKPQEPPDEIRHMPALLTRGVLSACAGGAFYPGIEMTCIAREPDLYVEAYRFDHRQLAAGDITKYMALPWQADFWECQGHWWPAQRPDDVITEDQFETLIKQFTEEVSGDFEQRFDQVLFNRDRWDRGVGRRSRPTAEYLASRLLPDPLSDTTAAYIDLLTARAIEADDPRFLRFRRMDSIANLLLRLTPLRDFEDFATEAWPDGESAERLPNPWRLQYLAQEGLDAYSGLYFHIEVPSPEDAFASSARAGHAAQKPAVSRVAAGGATGPGGRIHNKSGRALREIPGALRDEAAPATDEERLYLTSPARLRRDWNVLRLENPALAARLLGHYSAVAAQRIVDQARTILQEHPAAAGNAAELIKALSETTVSDLEQENPQDFAITSDEFRRLRAVEMIEQLTDELYLRCNTWSGDMDMVNDWRKHAFVVETRRTFPSRNKGDKKDVIIAQVETARPKYDGRTFRDYFYYLLNIQEYPDFEPYAKRLAIDILDSAQVLIDETGIFDRTHPESFVTYSRESFAAKLEEIYELLRSQAATALGWRTSRTREERIRRYLDTAPFNQTDGAWLRYIANAGPSDAVRSLLFEVWSDESGNGNPALHHGNLFTTLLYSLGHALPAINSRAYADNPDIDESSFIGAVFQLAISLHSEAFFPEILGMTLFLEWEVLSLVPPVKGIDYLGLDSQFWKMHVGIDNASEGHGAKARQAVELYLEHVFKEGGPDAMQAEWKRVWRGFVAFASAGYDYFANQDGQDDLTLSRRHPNTPEDNVKALMARKAHYGSLNHSGKRLGDHRMNDLFSDPDVFVDQLAHSPWVVVGKPDESKLLNYLTTFSGPMYKVFDQADLSLFRAWIEWLAREGDTALPKRYLTKAESMLILLSELRELAKGSDGHRRHRLTVDDGMAHTRDASRRLSLAELFAQGDLKELMKALRNPDNGWVVPFDPGNSSIVLELAQGGRAMGRALDRRFPSLGNQIGRQVLIKWIDAGCPIPGEASPPRDESKRSPKWSANRLFVQKLGMGAVH